MSSDCSGKKRESYPQIWALKLIFKWAEQGQSHCAIARKLNDQKLKPRHAEKWSQPTVGFIIKRHKKEND
jgi:hypothetical protein